MIFRNFRKQIENIINQSGLPIDAIYFVLKDVLAEVSEIYQREMSKEDQKAAAAAQEKEEDEKNNLNSDGNAILKGFLDHSFLIDYFVLDSVNVSKREQKRKIAKRAILLLTEEIHRIISLLISMGVKIDDEQLLKMIALEINNVSALWLVGAEDVKK